MTKKVKVKRFKPKKKTKSKKQRAKEASRETTVDTKAIINVMGYIMLIAGHLLVFSSSSKKKGPTFYTLVFILIVVGAIIVIYNLYRKRNAPKKIDKKTTKPKRFRRPREVTQERADEGHNDHEQEEDEDSESEGQDDETEEMKSEEPEKKGRKKKRKRKPTRGPRGSKPIRMPPHWADESFVEQEKSKELLEMHGENDSDSDSEHEHGQDDENEDETGSSDETDEEEENYERGRFGFMTCNWTCRDILVFMRLLAPDNCFRFYLQESDDEGGDDEDEDEEEKHRYYPGDENYKKWLEDQMQQPYGYYGQYPCSDSDSDFDMARHFGVKIID